MNPIQNFSQQAWQNYIENKETINNERLRPDNMSFWDVILSEEADFTRTPEGKKIAELIKDL